MYSEDDRALFFESLARLGGIAAAARELGFNTATCTMWAKDASREAGTKYSPEQKTEFLAVLDRTNNVAHTAKKLGINVQTAFHWAYSTGAVERTTRRNLTARQLALQPQKKEFLAILARVGNISASARKAGVRHSQGESWARAAGIENVPLNRGKREEYVRLRQGGAAQNAAAAAVGVSRRTAYRWDQNMASARPRAQGPDSEAPGYKEGVTTDFAVIGDPPDTVLQLVEGPRLPPPPEPRTATVEDLERVVDARYLSQPERERIADMLRAGQSLRAIGRDLGRSAGSISREIRRNSHPRLGYQPFGAQRSAAAARMRPKASKLAVPGRLRKYVESKLLRRWSPEQISHGLIKDFPDEPRMRVRHETIYQALYLQARGGLKRKVKDALRTGRTRRKKHKSPDERTSRFRDPMINISERPPEVEDRAVPGHWEGDLITGAYNQSAIATLVERTTRYVMLVHLPLDHTAESVRDGLIKTMSTLPAHLRGSLTWDQGAETAKHKAFGIAADMDVFFCDPASPWQRGSNENTNGLLRQYFPKGTDLNAYSPEDLEQVAEELNSRPRKTHSWDTPAERFCDLLQTT